MDNITQMHSPTVYMLQSLLANNLPIRGFTSTFIRTFAKESEISYATVRLKTAR